jgi:hypothetical protein
VDVDPLAKEVARLLAIQDGRRNPDDYAAGDAYGTDTVLPNGDPAHFVWREYLKHATAIIELVRSFKGV